MGEVVSARLKGDASNMGQVAGRAMACGAVVGMISNPDREMIEAGAKALRDHGIEASDGVIVAVWKAMVGAIL